MICPYCHQEIPQGSDRCPHCGRSIVQKPIEEEPRLSRGMKVFIAVGGALLAAFTIYNAVSHFAKNSNRMYFIFINPLLN